MMEMIKKYIFPVCVAALLYMYTGARFALDVVGWSTAPDDLGVAVSRLDQFFSWLMTIPVWMPFAGAVLLSIALVDRIQQSSCTYECRTFQQYI